MVKLKIKRLSEAARMPTYSSEDAACFDLYAAHAGEIGAHSRGTVDTGLAFEVPPGHALMVYSRSGHGFNRGVSLVNAVGVIDADYRGSVQVGLRNDSALRFDFAAGDRIAQAMIIPIPIVTFAEVKSLSETARGAGGFGSTGT